MSNIRKGAFCYTRNPFKITSYNEEAMSFSCLDLVDHNLFKVPIRISPFNLTPEPKWKIPNNIKDIKEDNYTGIKYNIMGQGTYHEDKFYRIKLDKDFHKTGMYSVYRVISSNQSDKEIFENEPIKRSQAIWAGEKNYHYAHKLEGKIFPKGAIQARATRFDLYINGIFKTKSDKVESKWVIDESVHILAWLIQDDNRVIFKLNLQMLNFKL